MRPMQKKTIQAVINKKMEAWLESISDEELRDQCRKDVIVTGGCIPSMLLGEEVNDFDVYFAKYETTVRLAKHYVNEFQKNRTAQMKTRDGVRPVSMEVEELTDTIDRRRVRIVVKSAGIAGAEHDVEYDYFETADDDSEAADFVDSTYAEGEAVPEGKSDFAPVFLSSNAITLKGGVQLIIRFSGDPSAIHENFDFAHAMSYWTFKEGVVLDPFALECILSKTLVYKGSLYPICSVFRSKKFIERGWSINAGQYLKMCLQIGQLDLEDFRVLEEQLTGVDIAYFSDVLSKAKSENDDHIDTAYLVEIINRMF